MKILCLRGIVVKRKSGRENIFFFTHRGSYFAGELARMANIDDNVTIYDRKMEMI